MTIDALKRNAMLLEVAMKVRDLIDAELPDSVLENMDGDPLETLKELIFGETVEIG